MRRLTLVLMLALGLAPVAARADEPTPPQNGADKPKPERVHLGATSVTVVDEHERVDDVITRLRGSKSDPTADKSKAAAEHDKLPVDPKAERTRTSEERSVLRAQRDRAAGRADAERVKDQKRERVSGPRARQEKTRK